MNRKILTLSALVLVIFFSMLPLAFSQTPEEIYRKANMNYENLDYEKAIYLYEMLIKMDRVSPEVYYNLGNSYFKLKKIGKAIVNYRRALRSMPRDIDAKLNLKLARTLRVDKIETVEKGFILGLISIPYEVFNIDELTILFIIDYLITIIFLIGLILFKRKTFLYVALVFASLSLITGIYLAIKINNEQIVKEAVVVVEKVDVRSGPRDDYLLQFTLHEGMELKIVGEKQDWFEISLSKDLKGWLPKSSVEVI